MNYYTDAVVKTDIKVLSEDREEFLRGLRLITGDVLVRTQVAKYKKLKFQTHENLGYGEVFLPEGEMHTRGTLICFDPGEEGGRHFFRLDEDVQPRALSALGTLVKNVAPLFLLCERSDLGVAERLKDPHTRIPTLYVYDNYPGGTGLADGFPQKLKEILAAGFELARDCPCREGCPSCVGAVETESLSTAPAGASFGGLKGAALALLRPWMDGPAGEDGGEPS